MKIEHLIIRAKNSKTFYVNMVKFILLSVFCCGATMSCKKIPEYSVSDSHLINEVYVVGPFLIEDSDTESDNIDSILLKYKNQKGKVFAPNREAYFDFNLYFPEAEEPSYIYCFFNIKSPDERVVSLGFNYAQHIKVWLNSKNVFDSPWKQNIKKQIEDHVIVQLDEGDNLIVVKLSRTDVRRSNHWEFYCSIQDIHEARRQYRKDYWDDFMVNPIYEDIEKLVRVYLGPYANSNDITLTLLDSQNKEVFVADRTLNEDEHNQLYFDDSWLIKLPESLSEGLYKSKLTLPDTVLNEFCFIGDFITYFDALSIDTTCQEYADLVESLKLRLEMLMVKRPLSNYEHDNTFNSRNIISVILQMQNVYELYKDNLPFKNQSGTFIKRYICPSDTSSQYYLIHVSSETLQGAKIPVVIYMPYNVPNPPIMPHSWYVSDIDFLNWEYRHADQYGFALLLPYLRAQDVYNPIADTDLKEVLKDLSKYYDIDDRKIFLLGGCSGGTKALMASFENSDLAAGIGISNGEYPDYVISNLHKLSTSLPILIAHSIEDEVPVEQADVFYREAKKYNDSIIYQRVEGGGHFNAAEDRDEVFFQFFYELCQKK